MQMVWKYTKNWKWGVNVSVALGWGGGGLEQNMVFVKHHKVINVPNLTQLFYFYLITNLNNFTHCLHGVQ